jgi:uncharacterized membrane protein YphA (DoxX/SURF4 family)
MNALGLAPLGRAADLGPLVLRVLVGGIMFAHGFQKWFETGPAEFGSASIDPLGLPAPEFLGYLVATSELVFGALLVLGLLTRLSTIPLGVILGVAVIGVKLGEVGLIAGMDAMLTGYEVDLALLAGLVALLFLGGGRLSLDRVLGLDRGSGPVRSAGAPV